MWRGKEDGSDGRKEGKWVVMEKYRMGDKKKDDYKDALNIHGNYRVSQKEACCLKVGFFSFSSLLSLRSWGFLCVPEGVVMSRHFWIICQSVRSVWSASWAFPINILFTNRRRRLCRRKEIKSITPDNAGSCRRCDGRIWRIRGCVGKPLNLISNVTDKAERPKRENFGS